MKIGVFIDNSNVFQSIHKLKKAGDFSWTSFYDPLYLAQRLAGNRELVSVKFYCTKPPAYMLKEGGGQAQKFVLTHRYYSLIEKMPMVEVKYGTISGEKGHLVEKNLDTQLTADVIAGAALREYDVAIIVSNDGDYVSAAETAKKFGVGVEIMFFKGSLSISLRKACNILRRARKSHFKRLEM